MVTGVVGCLKKEFQKENYAELGSPSRESLAGEISLVIWQTFPKCGGRGMKGGLGHC